MSKAFTSEETPELEGLAREPPRLRPGEVRYVTPEGEAALRADLARLRASLADAAALPETGRAAAVADLERRLALASGTLAVLTVLGPDAGRGGAAAFGSWVELEDEAGQRHTWRLVGPDEVDVRQGRVSVHAPLGRALLGRSAGDEVEVERPDGARTYTVLAVHQRRPPGGG